MFGTVCDRSVFRLVIACAVLHAVAGSSVVHAQEEERTAGPPVIFSSPLPEVPGSSLVVVELKFAPNTAPPSTADRHPPGHRHPGSVYVHVIEGSLRLGIEGQPVEVVHAGGSFFEPPDALHIVTENASSTEPATAIAVMIVPEGAPLVLPE